MFLGITRKVILKVFFKYECSAKKCKTAIKLLLKFYRIKTLFNEKILNKMENVKNIKKNEKQKQYAWNQFVRYYFKFMFPKH